MITRYAAVPALVASIALSVPAGADELRLAQMFDCSGTWAVETRLVAASKPVNPGYNEGDARVEQWLIRQSGTALQLTSQAGTIGGSIADGYTLVFADTSDNGLGVRTAIRIEARMQSPAAMIGTIRVDYFSSQFGQPIGLDAWTFQAVRGVN
jgi:hypothetical protein